jgi:hypothetical protein
LLLDPWRKKAFKLSPLTLLLSPVNGGEGGPCTGLVQGGGEGEKDKKRKFLYKQVRKLGEQNEIMEGHFHGLGVIGSLTRL